MMNKILISLLLSALLISCSNKKPSNESSSDSMTNTGNAFILASDDFLDNNPIPRDCACTRLGGNNRPPKLRWANAPKETYHFALIMQDETREKGDKATKHWAVLNLPASVTSIQRLIDQAPPGVTEGVNYKNKSGYAGPCPPGKHLYTFTVFALDEDMPLISPERAFTRSQFEREYNNFIIGTAAISGTYAPSQARLLLDRIKRKIRRIFS